MVGFEPRESLQNGHVMTLYSWGNPRHFPRLPKATRRFFDVARRTRVVADCHWQPARQTRATLIALHGLNGSSEAHYMRGLAAKHCARHERRPAEPAQLRNTELCRRDCFIPA
jgi:predicted alpha/beta-fold hydrolase